MIKIYIQCTEFRAHSVYQGKRKLLKHPECKKYIQYSENFQGKLCSSGQAETCSVCQGKPKVVVFSANFFRPPPVK